jgi:hypothetical protein
VTRRLVKAASRLASLIVLPGDLRRLGHERDVWEHLALRSTCTLHRYVEHHKGLPRAEVTSDLRCREVLLYARPRGPNMAAMDATSSALASIGVALRRPQECRLPPLPGTVHFPFARRLGIAEPSATGADVEFGGVALPLSDSARVRSPGTRAIG